MAIATFKSEARNHEALSSIPGIGGVLIKLLNYRFRLKYYFQKSRNFSLFDNVCKHFIVLLPFVSLYSLTIVRVIMLLAIDTR